MEDESLRSDVYAVVTLAPPEGGSNSLVAEHKGRFKWKTNISENAALAIVMKQFTRAELRRLRSITLDPIGQPFLNWLMKKRTYDFYSSSV